MHGLGFQVIDGVPQIIGLWLHALVAWVLPRTSSVDAGHQIVWPGTSCKRLKWPCLVVWVSPCLETFLYQRAGLLCNELSTKGRKPVRLDRDSCFVELWMALARVKLLDHTMSANKKVGGRVNPRKNTRDSWIRPPCPPTSLYPTYIITPSLSLSLFSYYFS